MSTANTDGESAWPPRRGSYDGESYSDKDGSWSWNEQYDRWNGVNGSKNVMLIDRGTEVCCNLENTKVMTYSDVIAENMRVHMSELDGPIKMMGGAGDVFGLWELLGIALGASDSNAKYAILPLMVVKGQGDDALKMLNIEKGAFSINKHGNLTDGMFTVSKDAMLKHKMDLGIGGKSIFYPTVNADEAVLKAAQYAEKNNLWLYNGGTKAKVPVLNTNVGTLGNGQPSNFINVYKSSNNLIHGAPGTPK